MPTKTTFADGPHAKPGVGFGRVASPTGEMHRHALIQSPRVATFLRDGNNLIVFMVFVSVIDIHQLTLNGGRKTRRTPPPAPKYEARVVASTRRRASYQRLIDGLFGDFQDPDGFVAQANRAACLGCEGKWAIQRTPPLSRLHSPTGRPMADNA